jgi:CrcB protein
MLYLYIALGSAAGGVTRYAVGGAVQRALGGTFPLGTLLINVTGSLLLCFLLRYAIETPAITPEARALLTTGFCGGYTTFSTFSYEAVALAEDGEWTRAAAYVAASVALSLLGAVAGIVLARELLTWRRGA